MVLLMSEGNNRDKNNSDSNNQKSNNKKDVNNTSNTFFEKGGFPIVLCSSIAVLVVTSLYFSNSSNSSSSKSNSIELDNLSVNSSDIKSYKESLVDNSNSSNISNTDDLQQAQLDNNSNSFNSLENLLVQVELDEDLLLQKEDTNKESSEIESSETESNNTETNITKKEEEESKEEVETKEKSNEEESKISSNDVSDSVNFTLFDDSKEMTWPVSGQIVMNYSADTAIYDKTLDLYRTNNSICISAPEGTEVLASADGIVEKIFIDNEKGNSVVINHGNGWVSTYSQLTEALNVSVGQVVDMCEEIGQVALPSNYSVLLGPHLDFTITKDDLTSDPLLVLANIE